jgi:hypothetical protein
MASAAAAGQKSLVWSSPRPQRPIVAARRRTTVAAAAYDPSSSSRQQQQQQQEEARGVLEAFYLGRAVASAVARRANEAALQLLAEVGTAAAEQPARLEALRQEILDEARAEVGREMGGGGGGSVALSAFSGAGGPAVATTSTTTTTTGAGASAAAAASAGGAFDDASESAEAVADELRADVAECRMLIRELRESGSSSSVVEAR